MGDSSKPVLREKLGMQRPALRTALAESRLALGDAGLGWAAAAFALVLVSSAVAVIERNELSTRLLALCIIGLAVAGLLFAVLLVRTAGRFRAQLREAQVAQARLSETLDALPAGAVLYDKDERLVMFNQAARATAPVLRHRNAIGMSYEEFAHETARHAAEFGGPVEGGPEQWIARFRSKGGMLMRQKVGERWYEFSEQPTLSGGTVALRVDVTDLKNREEELSRIRDLLQETLDALPAGVTVYDSEDRLLLFNKAAARVTTALRSPDVIGKTHEELTRRAYQDFARVGVSPPESVEAMIARFKQRTKRVRQLANGKWAEWSEVPGPNGGTIGLRFDITEVKQHELAAQEARAEYQSLVDSLSDTVYKLETKTGRVTFMSAAAAGLLGQSPAELIGTNFLDHVHPDDRDAILGPLREARDNPAKVATVQYRLIRPDGTLRHVEVRFRRGLDTAGVDTVSGVVRDISERVALEQRLDEERARLSSIVESSGALILLTDRELRITMANREFWKATGLDPGTTIGRSVKEVIDCPLDPEVLERWQGGALPAEGTKPVRYTATMPDATGAGGRLISVTAKPIVDERRLVRQIVFLGVDDTERRAAEQALQHSERLATVGEMAAAVAHEIAQPLQVMEIARYAALDELQVALEESKAVDAEFVGSKLERIGAQIERAHRIVNDLRAFVRPVTAADSGTVDPAEAVRSAIDLTQHALKLGRVGLSTHLPGVLPPVVGRQGALDQVLVNLINNARDAGATKIDVVGEAVDDDPKAPKVRIAVTDDGPGIPDEVLLKLFTSFVTTKPMGFGTGLGLRICRRIVEEMGGAISARNQPAGGARFEIVLPVAAPEVGQMALRPG